MVIKQIENLFSLVGRESIVQSAVDGLVPLQDWITDNVILVGPPKTKSVYVVCAPDARQGQSFFAAFSECQKKKINIAQVIEVERSILKMVKHETQTAGDYRAPTADDQILFDTLMKEAVSQGVSDILIDNDNGRYNVKFDVDTIVQPVRGITRDEAESMMRHFYQNIADQDVVEDPLFSFSKAQFAAGDGIWNDQKIRIRYQSKPSFPEGCDFALRLLNLSDAGGFSRYENLGVSDDQVKLLRRTNQSGDGATIVSGITSSGKTTSIKVMVEEFLQSQPGAQVRTAESPPEYIIRGARQHHVGEDISGETDVYAENIKELMRMRPDRIYIGEIRSRQTAELFCRAVLSGHGVFTTIHTDSPYEITTRLEGEGLSRDVLSSGTFINVLIYQKRLPKLCEHCKRPAENDEERLLQEKIQGLIKVDRPFFFQNPEGCEHCKKRGNTGSIVCMEIVTPNRDVRAHIREKNEEGFYQSWVDLAKTAGFGDAAETSLFHAIRNMVAGDICPKRVEQRYGVMDKILLSEKTHTWDEGNGFGIKLV
ncbi:ATPase, T2SS/T4P/T4SS family [Kistimonas asteriae]|uniref:ATPase, T2SS/T4P/T4SS family n=1 Tax=Kistimonas asteriae TaxID=517724 RepID=UPI001BAA1B0D|nr:ATPase, T2SS/T4P/T4SS family [Kistimonas asteriae]